MRIDSTFTFRKLAGLAPIVVVLAMAGCGMDDVEIPDFDGPSEFAESVRLTITPDVITADGFSTAFVQADFRGPDGRPLTSRDIFFAITDESGRFADIGQLFDLAGNQLGATDAIVRTNGQGLAQLVYRAPPRTDATANQSILVTARPVGTDFNGATYRTVRLELRSAEPRLFPQAPGNLPPICSFIVEAPDGFRVGRNILFQSTASDTDGGTIVRYEWFFGDGTSPVYFPDTNHTFRHPGSYVVSHVCTDDDGGQGAFQTTITVF